MYFFISRDEEAAGSGWRELLLIHMPKVNIGKHKGLDSGYFLPISEQSENYIAEVKRG
jgi:hypothetical protein